jgi:hypothetical protein
MFEDLIGTENNNNENRTNDAATQEENIWDTGLIWDTGRLPKEVWKVD